MQLSRNLFLGPDERYEQSMDRKVLEAGLAQELNELFSKDEILEMYLNLANYGHLAYGPEAASQVYFGKPASQLTLAEAALLAGIPQSPARLDPFANLPGAKERQRTVLDLMVRHGYLAQAEADAAYFEPLTLNPDPDRHINVVPHFVNYVSDVLDARLGGSAGLRSGLTITSTLDLRFQALAQDIVAKQVKALKPKHDLSNGSLVAMLPYSGEILAMVGSADFNDTKIAGQVNVDAVDAPAWQLHQARAVRRGDGRPAHQPGHGAVGHPRLVPYHRHEAVRAAQLRREVPRTGHGSHRAGEQLQRPGRQAARCGHRRPDAAAAPRSWASAACRSRARSSAWPSRSAGAT